MLVPREFSPQFCLHISRSEKEGRVEIRDRKGRREREGGTIGDGERRRLGEDK